MSDTLNGTIRVKVTKLQVVGQIVVAVLGLAGAGLAVWANRGIDETVSRLDEDIIPSMQKRLDELQADLKTLVRTIADLRERLAKIEGAREEAVTTRWLLGKKRKRKSTEADKVEMKLDKILKKKSARLPMVQMAK